MLTFEVFYSPHYITQITRKEMYKGIWWLAGNPSHKVSGELIVYPDRGAFLDLNGSLINEDEVLKLGSLDDSSFEANSIIGENRNGGKITLHKCKCIRVVNPAFFSGAGNVRQLFFCRFLLKGIHATSPEKIKFSRFTFLTTYLLDFIDPDLIKKDFEKNIFETKDSEQISIETDKARITFYAKSTCNFHTSYYDISLQQFAGIEVIPKGAESVHNFISGYMNRMLTFISFATGKANSITSLSGFDSQNREVEIYHPSRYERVSRNEQEGKLFFTLKECKYSLKNVLTQWMNFSNQFEAELELFLNRTFNPRMSDKNSFLDIVNSLESLHRQTTISEKIPKQKYKTILKDIKKVVPEEYREFLMQKFSYCYENTLKSRLLEIVESNHSLMFPIIGDGPKFVHQVGDTRNYFAHHTPALREKAAKGDTLHIMYWPLFILMAIEVLKFTGFDQSQIENLIKRSKIYKNAISIIEKKQLWK